MEKTQITVDGKNMGLFPSSQKLSKLGILKGIEVRKVLETEEDRKLRLEARRAKRKVVDATPPNCH